MKVWRDERAIVHRLEGPVRPSVLRFTTVTLLCALAAASAAPAGAQALREIHTGIAAGAALGQGRNYPGFALLGSADVARAASRFGVRGELFYSRASREEQGLMGVACDACSALLPYTRARSTEQAFGALVGATYALTNATRARPYLLGGLGVYRTRTDFEGTLGSPCPPEMLCATPFVAETRRHDVERSTGAGMHLGLGSAFRVGGLDLTAEARYHVLDSGVGSRRLIPLTLGVRF